MKKILFILFIALLPLIASSQNTDIEKIASLVEKKDYRQAATLLEALVNKKHDPNSTYKKIDLEALLVSIYAESKDKNYDKHLKNTYSKYPGDPLITNVHIQYLRNSKKYDRALSFIDSLLTTHPEYTADYLFTKGRIYIDKEDERKAELLFTQAFELDNNRVDEMIEIGRACMSRGFNIIASIDTETSDIKYKDVGVYFLHKAAKHFKKAYDRSSDENRRKKLITYELNRVYELLEKLGEPLPDKEENWS